MRNIFLLSQFRLHKKKEEKMGKGKGRQGEGKGRGRKKLEETRKAKRSPVSTLAPGGCCPRESMAVSLPYACLHLLHLS